MNGIIGLVASQFQRKNGIITIPVLLLATAMYRKPSLIPCQIVPRILLNELVG
jgi:hypothetical protein